MEDVRVRNLCADADTTYTYNTNCKLSQLLEKTTNGITTKYVYGNGLIGEEKCGEFKTYHFDFRGSTVAITNEDGNVIDTFKHDTYGNVTEHIGNSFVIFGYNGRDGVVTDKNGLIYMRARYYSPAMRRFVNADILHGEISDPASLNRYSYVNGNPVSYVDPFGLSKERGGSTDISSLFSSEDIKKLEEIYEYIGFGLDMADATIESLYIYLKEGVSNAVRPSNIPIGVWSKQIETDLKWIEDMFGPYSKLSNSLDILSVPWLDIVDVSVDVGKGISDNIQKSENIEKIVWDATVDVTISGVNVYIATSIGAAIGSVIPVPALGTLVGAVGGAIVGVTLEWLSSGSRDYLKTLV